jgi:hypothetical protein
VRVGCRVLPFDPQEIIERFQAGEWLDDPDYWAIYMVIWQDQNDVTLFAEERWDLKGSDTPENRLKNPDLKRKAVVFDEELLAAAHAEDTAYLERHLRAVRLLKKGRPKWSFSKLALVYLAIIHLRENHHQQSINPDDVHKLVVKWERANKKRAVSDKSQWYRILKRPEICRLLAHR